MALSKITNASVADTAVYGRRNIVINGAMQVAQRGTSFTSAANNTYPVDRFRVYRNGMDNLVYNLSQSTTSPDGFSNSLKIEVTTAETANDSNENLKIIHRIEAQNLQHLNYGLSSAKTTTMSFWVRSSTTGVYPVEIYASDANRHITNTYTVNSADTWEYKTITFVGDASGSINNDNGIGFDIGFYLSTASNLQSGDSTAWRAFNSDGRGYGQTADVAASTGTFHLTGVQLEVGDTATPFEHRSYGEELALCQRYYQKDFRLIAWNLGSGNTTSAASGSFPVVMRATPTAVRTANGGLTSTAPSTTTMFPASGYIYSSSSNACSSLLTLDAEL